jgi:DNA-binding MarR family transcriptional regulator
MMNVHNFLKQDTDTREQAQASETREALSAHLIDVARAMVELMCQRKDHFPGAIFQDPQWMMTLELFIAAEEGRSISISSLCDASGVPATTALRHVRWLESKGFFERTSHPRDKRISHIHLSANAREQMALHLMAVSTRRLSSDRAPLSAAH